MMVWRETAFPLPASRQTLRLQCNPQLQTLPDTDLPLPSFTALTCVSCAGRLAWFLQPLTYKVNTYGTAVTRMM
jgi:hypothetical protein